MRAPMMALVFLAGAALLPAQNLTGVKAIAASGNTSFALLSDGTVWGWGEDDTWEEILGGGQATPARWGNLTDVVAVSPPLALKADGTVWAYWFGATDPSTPIRVNGLTGSVAVAGGWTSLALKSDGTVWEWYGTLAFGVPSTPVRVSGLTEVVAIARLYRHSLALRGDGTVWAWGDNKDGLLGDGLALDPSTDPRFPLFPLGPDLSTPAQVTGLSDVVAVAAGCGHSLALKSDGTVWAWGFNGHGQLGDGTTASRMEPAQVSGLAGVVRIAAGDAHGVAVKGDGTVWAWGSNVGGQLGDGTTTERLKPVQVSGLTGTAAVAAGRYHSLALKDDGTLWAWGDDQFGQLGDGREVQPGPYEATLGPLQVGGLTGVTKIAAGLTHSLALKSDGTVWAWGDNTSGELGDGQVRAADWPDRSTPVKVSGLAGVAAVAGGNGQSFAVTGDGAVWAWGLNAGIADGMPTDASTPVQMSGLSGVVSVTPGVSLERDFRDSYYHLAVCNDGSLWKWSIPRPGDPIPAGPVPMAELSDVRMAAASPNRNVALKRDGTVWEWGIGGPKPPWPGATEPRPTPSQVSGLADVVAVVAASDDEASYHSLALKRDGTVWAWGNNNRGELGDGTRTERATPVQVAGLSDVAAVDTRDNSFLIGYAHSVALKNDGTVWEWPIWEWPIYWQEGPKSLTPVQVAGLTDVVAVAEGGGHSLALKRDGTVWAWGQNISGQLGVQTIVIRTTPVQVVGPATQ